MSFAIKKSKKELFHYDIRCICFLDGL